MVRGCLSQRLTVTGHFPVCQVPHPVLYTRLGSWDLPHPVGQANDGSKVPDGKSEAPKTQASMAERDSQPACFLPHPMLQHVTVLLPICEQCLNTGHADAPCER